MRPAYLEPQTVELRYPLGGLVDDGVADLLREQDFSRLINFHMDNGGLTVRRGRFLVGTCPEATEAFCLFHMRTDTKRELLAVLGIYLVRFPEGGAAPVGAISGVWPPQAVDQIGNGQNLGAMVQFNNFLFYADGGAQRLTYAQGTPGTIVGWGYQGGQQPAAASGGAATAGGDLTVGAYYGAAYAYRDPLRAITTNHSPRVVFGPVAAPNQTQPVTAPAFLGWPAQFTEIVWYRTLACADAIQAATEGLHEEKTVTGVTNLLTVPNTTSLSIADGELLIDAPAEDAEPPVPMDYIILWNNRIVGYKGSHLFYSEDGTTEGGVWVFPPFNDVAIELNTGDGIGGLFHIQGELYVVKRAAGVFLLHPFETEDGLQFRVQKQVGSQVGCSSPFAVVVADNLAYWLDDMGAIEFDGTNARCISDSPEGDRAGIGTLFQEYRATGRLRKAYAVLDRQPDKNQIRWIVPRDTESTVDGVTSTYACSDTLVFDLKARTWHVERPAGDPAADRMTGLFERVACQYRDEDDIEERGTFVYTADEDGNVYRHRTDEALAEVFTDNGSFYVAEARSRLYGDGINWILPLEVAAEIQRSIFGKTAGTITCSIWRGGFAGTPKEQTFALFDELASDNESEAIKMNADRGLTKRFAFGFKLEGGESDLTIVGAMAQFQWCGKALRGT